MIAGLERFVVELRRAGLSASPAEWIDAVRAVDEVGVGDRERFRVALRCALAKRVAQQRLFDEAFARFFSTPGRGGVERGRRATAGAGGAPRGPAPVDAPRALPRLDRSGPSDRRPRSEMPRLQPDLQALVARLLDGVPRRVGRLRHIVVEPRHPSSREGRMEHVRAAPGPPGDPRRRDLRGRLASEDEREIAAEVPRLVERIRLRSARRTRRSLRGTLYLRRVFRENVSRGGVPFVLPRRRRRSRRSRVVLLVDVSWSTARAAGLFLLLAHEFLRRARDTRTLFFVDRAVDGTTRMASWLRREAASGSGPARERGDRGPGSGIVRGGVSFSRLIGGLPGLVLDAPSDYGRAFDGLLRSTSRPSGRDTLLLVLGDGRTNRFDPQDWAFEEIASRCGAVLWLVPESIARWGTGDSALGAYLPHADVAVEATDLEGLARGVGELIRRL